MIGPADRLEQLLKPAQNLVTGIDFVYVFPNQTTLDVFFLRPPLTLSVPLNNPPVSAVRIYSPSGGERHAEVPVTGFVWDSAFGRDVLRVTTAFPGDFSRYRLHIEDTHIPTRIDRYFNDVWFSFKANCPSDLDCKPPEHECPPDTVVDFPVDYTARDFWSFRRALLDFASQRYPKWQDRLEADVGVMLAETMSALGDEFAYYQDRVGREAYLETATQRRSLRRLASLVDYPVHDGLGASTWLDFEVNADGTIPAGTQVSDARGRITFEVGRGIDESLVLEPPLPPPQTPPPVLPSPPLPPPPTQYAVKLGANNMRAYQWDVGDACLPVGVTELFVFGHHAADLPLDDTPPGRDPGKWLLLKTNPTNPAVQARAWMVRIIVREDLVDPVLPDPTLPSSSPPTDITRLQWEPEQATPFELDRAKLEVHGNMLPATAGALKTARFMIGPSDDEVDHPPAIERTGPDGSIAYLFSLPGSDEDELVWRGPTPMDARPELRLTSWTLGPNPLNPSNPSERVWNENSPWSWVRAPIGVNSAQPADPVFALDDGTWRRVVGYRRIAGDVVHRDYAADRGKTIRFGDGEFGLVPTPPGTLFQVHYRLGGGAKGNVPAGTLTKCSRLLVDKVTNPLAVVDGMDAETPEQIRQLAPEAFRAVTYRAVRPEDYAEAAERLPWVQKAGAAFRWTGSWLDAFVTPDPLGAFEVAPARRLELEDQIERFRQAGRPAYMLDPVYADLDLSIAVCVEPHGFRGEVEEQVLIALFGKSGIRPRVGFFSPDNFTFGQPLERSRVEAVIQDVPGVRAVEGMLIRRRGWFPWRAFGELTYRVGDNELVRVENNRLAPGRGSVSLEMKGGA